MLSDFQKTESETMESGLDHKSTSFKTPRQAGVTLWLLNRVQNIVR